MLSPEDNDLLCKKLMMRIQEILLWHAWPKFTPREDESVPMKCTISVFGKSKKLCLEDSILGLLAKMS